MNQLNFDFEDDRLTLSDLVELDTDQRQELVRLMATLIISIFQNTEEAIDEKDTE